MRKHPVRALEFVPLLLILLPLAAAAPVCVGDACALHDASKTGAGSCDASPTSYAASSLTQAESLASGYRTRVVIQQNCSASTNRGETMQARSTRVEVYSRAPDGFERGVAAGWYSYQTSNPYGTYGDCSTWTETRNINQPGFDHRNLGCPAGKPPGIVLP